MCHKSNLECAYKTAPAICYHNAKLVSEFILTAASQLVL